ncbi:hypothetical protein [Sediminitomix flava]|uniref:Uncharacterized protein n=1 Tax=Sediminitomix flava TaxID=379075 RepID=A0A315ZCM8_SEDFL|nr:hypothetical protein [Sediminitomix flava]PWJ43052.1 hypothetical protein BC781_102600 [Sediminitomix flava]
MTISNHAVHQLLVKEFEEESINKVEERLKEKLAEIQRRQLFKYKKELSQEAFDLAIQSSEAFTNRIFDELIYEIKSSANPFQVIKDLETVFDL